MACPFVSKYHSLSPYCRRVGEAEREQLDKDHLVSSWQSRVSDQGLLTHYISVYSLGSNNLFYYICSPCFFQLWHILGVSRWSAVQAVQPDLDSAESEREDRASATFIAQLSEARAGYMQCLFLHSAERQERWQLAPPAPPPPTRPTLPPQLTKVSACQATSRVKGSRVEGDVWNVLARVLEGPTV